MLQDRISYAVIEKAIAQDERAILEVVAYYRKYIRYLSLRELVLENGERIQCVDEEMALRLESKLMASIPKFKIRAEL